MTKISGFFFGVKKKCMNLILVYLSEYNFGPSRLQRAPIDRLLIFHTFQNDYSMKPCQRWDQSSWQNGCFSNTFIFSIFPNDPPGTPMLIPKNALDFTKEGTMLPLHGWKRRARKTLEPLLLWVSQGSLTLMYKDYLHHLIHGWKMIGESFQLFSRLLQIKETPGPRFFWLFKYLSTSTVNLSAAASKGEETCSVSNCVRAESTRTWRLMDPH